MDRHQLPTSWGDLAAIVAAIPPAWLVERRWFGGKARAVRRLALERAAPLAERPPVWLALVRVDYGGGEPEVYQLPLAFPQPGDAGLDAGAPPLPGAGAGAPAYEAYAYAPFRAALADLVRRRGQAPLLGPLGPAGTVAGYAEPALDAAAAPGPSRPLGAEQSNTSLLYDRAWVLKSFRRLAAGESRDLEVARFFAEHAPFRHTPPLGGWITALDNAGTAWTLAVLQGYVPNQGDGWEYVLAQLRRGVTSDEWRVTGGGETEALPDSAPRHSSPVTRHVSRATERLGEITAEMHRALGSREDVPAFAPRPVGPQDVEAWADDLRRQAAAAASASAALRPLIARLPSLISQVRATCLGPAHAPLLQLQVHGDYHLGQVLKTDDGFVVIDFEGEPVRPLAERRAPQSPLRDVAGMLRSFGYAAAVASDGDEARAGAWEEALGAAFLEGYLRGMAGSALLPAEPARRDLMLRFFQVSKALYELNYELGHRPQMVEIPLRGLSRLVRNL